MHKLLYLALLLPLIAPVCSEKKTMTKAMTLSSNSFAHQGAIPSVYTCEGEERQPDLAWKNVAANAQSLALIMEDPDTSHGTFVHWVAWNIEPSAHQLVFGHSSAYDQGTNGAGKIGYKGPCPPSNKHRYFFRLYALDSKLTLPPSTTKEELLNAIKAHIIGEAELMGTYEKKAP